MKKRLVYLILSLLTLLAIFPSTAFASDVSNAIWRGYIRATNNGTSTAANVAAVVSINTSAVVSNEFTSENLDDMALQYNGSDVYFMPGPDDSAWCFWIDSIASTTYTNYDLYTGGAENGTYRYFPDITGLTITDNSTFELSDNATIQIEGWFNTDNGSDKNILEKQDAIRIFVDETASENITTAIFDSGTSTLTLRPSGVGTTTDIDNANPAVDHYLNVDEAAADDATTYVYTWNVAYLTDTYSIDDVSGEYGRITNVEVYYRIYDADADGKGKAALYTYDTLYNGTEQNATNVWTTNSYSWANNPYTSEAWTWSEINDLEIGVSIKDGAGAHTDCTQVYVEITYYDTVAAISATGVENGEHEVRVKKNPFFLGMAVNPGGVPTAPSVGSNLLINVPFWSELLTGASFTSIDSNSITINSPNPVWTSEGRYFDGVDDVITAPNQAAITKNGTYTICMWIKPDAVSGFQAFLQNSQAATNRNGVTLHNNNLYFISYNGTAYNGESGIIGTDWVFISGTNNAGVLNLWIDTVAQTGMAGSPSLASGSAFLYMGETSGGTQDVAGYIGEIQVYDAVLTESQMEQIYDDTKWKYTGDHTDDIFDYVYCGVSVPDTANDLILFENNSLMYVEEFTIEVDGATVLNYDFTTPLTSTTAYDTTANITGTATFRTTSSDPDVSAELISFTPISKSEVDSFILTSTYSILTGIPTTPTNMFVDGDYSKLPAEPINEILDESDVPRAAWWLPFLFLGICVIGLIVYGATTITRGMNGKLSEGQLDGSLLFMFLVMEAFLIALGKMGPIPYWPAFIFPIAGLAIIMSKKHHAWG